MNADTQPATQAIVEAEFVKALSIAKIGFYEQDNCTFFASVCLSLTHKIDWSCPTAYTNGIIVGYNPEFFLSQSLDVRKSNVFHEVAHVFLQHVARCLDRDFQLFNISCDHAANLIGKAAGFTIPSGWFCDPRFTGMSAEQIYDILLAEQPDQSTNQPQFGGLGADLRQPETAEEAAAIKAEIDTILVQATMQSKMAGDATGSIPEEIERYVKELINPKVPWHKLMLAYARKFSKESYSMSKPNRRFFPDFYLPSRHSEKMDRCAFIVDASGSVTDDEFSHMILETTSFMKQLQPEKIDFIQFSTEIKSNNELKSIKDVGKVDFINGGGTKIGPVFDWIIENKPVVAVIFTDGCFHMPELHPKTPILWIIHNNPEWTASFGRVIHFEFDPQ